MPADCPDTRRGWQAPAWVLKKEGRRGVVLLVKDSNTGPSRVQVVRKGENVPARHKGSCPRCGARLWMSYEEPECVQCGYVDYSYDARAASDRKKGVISTGTEFVVRYVGDFASMANMVLRVKLMRNGNRLVYGMRCPFCGDAMRLSSLGVKRWELREERYKCGQGHRLLLSPDKDGSLGWK